jgi:predicted HicB family RNase H-like nuclease
VTPPSPVRPLEYKGYRGRYDLDRVEGVLHGRVDGIRDIVTFVADTEDELEREFRISVDDYLEWCAEDGVEPNRPASQDV